jgi:hypothetical protein
MRDGAARTRGHSVYVHAFVRVISNMLSSPVGIVCSLWSRGG